MSIELIRQDVEGELVRCSDQHPPCYAKRLSMSIAWQVFDPGDLENPADSLVQSVEVNTEEAAYIIYYLPTLEPLDLLALRKLLPLDGPLAVWRVLKAAADLAAHLQSLHEEDIPQLVVHPERVGRCEGKLVLLPTMAGVLPPLSRTPPNKIAGWLHFIAPEVLRTRGSEKALLFQSDVYSFGRLMQALCVASWNPDDSVNSLSMVEQKVESLYPGVQAEPPPSFGTAWELFDRMSSALPEDRPTLDDIRAELAVLLERSSPECLFTQLLTQRCLDEADRLLSDLKDAERAGVFGCSPRAIDIMTADLALAQSPPDCSQAILVLQRAESPDYYEADIQQRLGKSYALYSKLPGHLQRSSEAYERAARLTGWRSDIIDEWVPVLEQLGNPDAILSATTKIPIELRSRNIVALRTNSLLKKGDVFKAWTEIACSFARLPFDEALFELARTVARQNDKLKLVSWMNPFKDEPGLAAPVSIVWEVNGNEHLAREYLSKAKARKP